MLQFRYDSAMNPGTSRARVRNHNNDETRAVEFHGRTVSRELVHTD